MADYIELTFIVHPLEQGNDVLISQLSELGFESFVEIDTGFTAYIPEHQYDSTQLNLALSFYTDFFKFSYETKIIPQQNWNKEWESNFQPIDIDGKCCIRAPFHKTEKKYLYDIIIEPKMSFGTGHHNTTQLMIQQLMKMDVKGKSLLDMGCGTGVLAIMASMMGSNPVTAIDTDDWSYTNTVENLQKNNINNVFVHKGNAQILEGKLFHTILANINKNVLLADMSIYVESLEKQGDLVLSGFFETDVDELKHKALAIGLKFEDKAVSSQWTMLWFIKK
ncbi:MAG: 50S ribosomal protein L11 methyltransferase [Bacteroidetes bacterium]|nr:50S ribosomal protein L11 methyltransferase [Bacteroidota bacterium]